MSEGSARNVGGVDVRPGSDLDTHVRGVIGKAIRVRREKAQMTQAEAAEAIGISRDTLIRWERGEGSLWTGGDAGCVDHQAMGRLKEVYRCAMSEIMPRNQYPSAPLDPALRREFFWYRNATIQRVEDVEGHVQTMRDLYAERAGATPDPKTRERDDAHRAAKG